MTDSNINFDIIHSLFIDERLCNSFKKSRSKNDHKGIFGHALLIAGSVEKFGAAILSAKACMRSGVGLLTVDIPSDCRTAMNIALPEAMIDSIENAINKQIEYQSIGIGPGIGIDKYAYNKLFLAITKCLDDRKLSIITNLVVDADGLNILSKHQELMELLPNNTILTPHPKEFVRLFGEYHSDSERIAIQKSMSAKYGVIIVYKVAETAVSLPDGRYFINTSGNPGMATGGSGDVLTGLITGLLSRGYSPEEAAILGVFSHGIAGDKAAEDLGQESMIASDIVERLKL